MNEFTGVINAEFIDIRFAYSGKILQMFHQTGDEVKKGTIIASLDKKLMQVELDKQLAEYEKTRADFELFSIKYGTAPDTEDTVKYLRQKIQADLNSAVKDIEIAKFRMDQTDMISPVHGIVADLQGMTPGLYITPASNPVTIIDTDSLVFSMQVPQEELFQFRQQRMMKIQFPGIDESFTGVQKLPVSGKNGIFTIPVPLTSSPLIYPGMKGQATFKLD